MNNSLADQLSKAIDAKKNDVNSFVWKGAKKYVNGERVQEEIKLMDAPVEQIQKYYAHCKSMLYSTDRDNPGRYTLLKIIRDQYNRCNAVLYMRYLRNPSDPTKNPRSTNEFYKELRDFLDREDVKLQVPQSKWKEIPIDRVFNAPVDFKNIPIDVIIDACLTKLGRFKKKHITLNFLLKMGLWFTKQEIKEYLTITGADGKPLDKLEAVRRNLNLKPDVHLRTNNKGGLSYLEFRAMYNLHDMQYEEMSTIQLETLRDKVLFRLEIEVREHVKLWEEKIRQIEKVCEARGIRPE